MGASSAGVCIQGSSRISSSEGREQGLGARHRRIRAQQSVGSRSTREISSQQRVPSPGRKEACGVSEGLTWGDMSRKVGLSLQNLLVPLEGNVPTDHVIEEDTQ